MHTFLYMYINVYVYMQIYIYLYIYIYIWASDCDDCSKHLFWKPAWRGI